MRRRLAPVLLLLSAWPVQAASPTIQQLAIIQEIVACPAPGPGTVEVIGWTGKQIQCVSLPAAQQNINFSGWVIPSGAIDGVNAVFTLPSSPTNPGFLELVLNSLVMCPASIACGAGPDYTLSGVTLTFTIPPPLGSTIMARFH